MRCSIILLLFLLFLVIGNTLSEETSSNENSETNPQDETEIESSKDEDLLELEQHNSDPLFSTKITQAVPETKKTQSKQKRKRKRKRKDKTKKQKKKKKKKEKKKDKETVVDKEKQQRIYELKKRLNQKIKKTFPFHQN
ncbi:ca-responsive protein [Anaeramoeba flamelloides]|uniref:Ca-responsive protein n=1 Tax=Anaeramoeba flamelloides TaxID=1746091 RepID=A0AAV8A7A2_9EUKA|nr:ca-responsive protein [Anaeramoeba flamelloides]